MAKQVAPTAAMKWWLPLILLSSLFLLGVAADDSAAKDSSETPIKDLLPDEDSLFRKDAIDKEALDDMDCHLRNMDYCLAGVIGSAGKMLPENDAALESRCDEMVATTTCMSVFENRCETFRLFRQLIPQANMGSGNVLSGKKLAEQAKSFNISLDQVSSQLGGAAVTGDKFELTDLLKVCDKSEKGTPKNTAVRQKLFEMSKCVNARLPSLKPCIDDVKTAMQLIYEPNRTLQRKPACCAWGRFRDCATKALDNVCGFQSFSQLEQTLQAGPLSMLKSFTRACDIEPDFKSDFCVQALPPSGLKVPARRGQKASKFARILDLVQFAGN